MKGDPLPDTNHILRYISKTKYDIGPDGRIIVTAEAFLGKPLNPSPSVNWVEKFPAPFDNQIAEIRRRTRLTYSKSGCLVRLNVGQVRSKVSESCPFPEWQCVLVVEHPLDPDPPKYPFDDPSHAEIAGVPLTETVEGIPVSLSPEAQAVGDLIAQCVLDHHLAIAA